MITKTWMMLAIGLGLSATVAEASPFIINTASSSGGRSRRSGGGGGGGFGGGGSMSSRSWRAPGPIAMPAVGAGGAATEGIAPLQSQGPAPNTSPFGSGRADISAIVSTAAFGGGAMTPASLPSVFSAPAATPGGGANGTPNTVAFLDLGGDEFLAVTPPVAGGLAGQTPPAGLSNPRSEMSESATGGVRNPYVNSGNGSGNSAGGSNTANDDRGLDTGTVGSVLPVVGSGLVTYPTDVLTGLAATSGLGGAAIANPEPASLVLLGTGLAIAARRKLRRKRS